ncbi:rhombosortase [Stagnimonas aquatica]|uniref:Rhombosortase n=2 Tax=Stagnimonas aquatica TaxID=2689987 RepID=A0A3N0VAJ6_9GAMM|nr:rhombosortase [Stagnimonas aquatica]
MALIALLALGGEPWINALRYDRVAIAGGEWWRLLTGNLVHLPGNTIVWEGFRFHGPWHLFLNELGVLVLVLLCPERLSAAVWARRVILLGLGMSAGLYFYAPDLRWYVGLSGVMHGLFLLGLMPQALKKDIVALGCILYLLGKLGYELYAGAPVSDEHAIGGKVALDSHLWGAISGLVYGLVFRSFWKPERWAFWR